MSVERVGSAGLAARAGAVSFEPADFLAKVSGGGDLATVCQALLARDGEAQYRAGRLGVDVQKRQMAEARQRRFETLQKYRQAARKSSFWSRLAGSLGAIFAAATAAMAVVGLPVGAVALTGAAATGGAKIAGANQNLKAADAQAGMVRQEAMIDFHRSEMKVCGEFMEQAARFEADMVRRLQRVCEQQYGARLW